MVMVEPDSEMPADGDADEEFERVLRNLVNTPHKPHKPHEQYRPTDPLPSKEHRPVVK